MEDAQNVSFTTVMDLPGDCLVFIFKRLSCESDRRAFGLTCRRWLEIQNQNRRSLQFDCSLTNFMVPLSGTYYRIDTFKLHKTLNRFPHLKSLSLSGCTELLDSGLKALENYGCTLRALHLDCCFKITDSGLSFVAIGCPSLTFISLYRCNISDTGLETLAKSCLCLEVINLSYCCLITDQGIETVVQNCFKLHAIRISNCEGLTGVGFQGCSQTLAYMEAESCKLEPVGISSIVSGGGLKYLNLANLSWSIHGDGLALIGAGWGKRLQVLNTRLCRTLRDESVAAIAKGCPSLVEWNLALCHEIKVDGWESIALNCHNLEKLHVNRCRNLCDRGLQALENGCNKLSILYMNGCPRVSAFAVELFRLARGDVVIKGEENLELAADFRVIMTALVAFHTPSS
ncbi:F-box/LRR-repeat protein 12 [Silene latifolia]|uniref:F-box/LRR-repeat protein 12 n=1 Tax=Silene latifolia TaxID=37657 RepID=UPI003D787F4E